MEALQEVDGGVDRVKVPLPRDDDLLTAVAAVKPRILEGHPHPKETGDDSLVVVESGETPHPELHHLDAPLPELKGGALVETDIDLGVRKPQVR